MADNKVNFLRGTSAEYKAATKDNDTFYYTTDTKKLYLGETEITGIEVDDTSTTATDKTWSAKKINDSIPTELPANGGNADTVDGKHASDFMQNLGYLSTGSLLDYVLTLTSSGSFFISNSVTDTPVSGLYYGVDVIRHSGRDYVITATRFNGGGVWTNRYNADMAKWYGWANVADGGNADTLDGLHVNEIASNPNLLINPDFAVNQRGLTSYSYTTNGYTVDRWKINSNAKLTVNDGFVTFENTTEKAIATLYQIVENPAAFSGKTVTLSFDYDLKSEGASITIQALANNSWTPPVSFNSTGRSVKSSVITLPENLTDLRCALIIHSTDSAPLAIVDIYGAKLELGEIATPFTPPDPATELAKCQRYYQIHSTGDIAAVDLRPSMATIKDIKPREDGNYEYIAEL